MIEDSNLPFTYNMGYNTNMELVFEIMQESDGGYVAECLSEDIYTQGDSWDAMKASVKEAVDAYFFDKSTKPKSIRLHLVRDEVLSVK